MEFCLSPASSAKGAKNLRPQARDMSSYRWPRLWERVAVVPGIIISMIVSALGLAAAPREHSTDGPEAAQHWLIGLWEGTLQGRPAIPGSRLIHVVAVGADGAAQGTMGVADNWPDPADIRVDGSKVRVVNAAKRVIDLTRIGDDRLVGTLTVPNGTAFAVTFVRQTRQREQAYATSFREDSTDNAKCTTMASLVATPTFSRPRYCVGDTWTYSPGWRHRVVGVDEDTVTMVGVGPCGTCRYHYDRNLNLQKVERADGTMHAPDSMAFWQGPEFRYWDFPLEVKKSWNFSTKARGADGSLVFVEVALTVDALEDVRTQAGTFTAFRVRRDWKVSAPGYMQYAYTFRENVWFAPAVKWIVKSTSTDVRYGNDWELVSYRLR